MARSSLKDDTTEAYMDISDDSFDFSDFTDFTDSTATVLESTETFLIPGLSELEITRSTFKSDEETTRTSGLQTPNITLEVIEEVDSDVEVEIIQNNRKRPLQKKRMLQPTAPELSTPAAQEVLDYIGLKPQGRMVMMRDKQKTRPGYSTNEDLAIPSTSNGITGPSTFIYRTKYPCSTRKKSSIQALIEEEDEDFTTSSAEYEQRICEEALKKCSDDKVKNLLSFESLSKAYKSINEDKDYEALGAKPKKFNKGGKKKGHSKKSARQISWQEDVSKIFELCWFGDCNNIPLKGCCRCYLTYCLVHISKDVHGCTREPVDRASRFKRMGAHYASYKVKELGREVEETSLSPVLCDCEGDCSNCKFYYFYIKYFSPHATAVSEEECFLDCN